MKTEAFSAIFAKVAVGVATGATLAGSGALITTMSTNAVQDKQLVQLESSFDKVEKLSDQLTDVNKNMAVLQERLEQEARYRESRQ